MARVIATRSKDPDTQIGSVIVSYDNRIVSCGFNGPPACVDDDFVNWNRPNKYDWVIHAEQNAIIFGLQARRDLTDCILYVTGEPCSKCMLLIAAVGIKQVKYGQTKSTICDKENWEKVLDIATEAGITLTMLE